MLRGIFLLSVLLFLISSSYQEEISNSTVHNNNVNTKLLNGINFIELISFKFKDTKRPNQSTIEEEMKTLLVPAVKNVRFSEETPASTVKAEKRTHSRNAFDFTKIISNNSEDIDSRIYISGYNLNTTWGNLGKLTGIRNKVTEGSNGSPMPVPRSSPPDYFDWRDEKAVSPVKDQKQCRACWAFSVVANIESMLKIHLKQEYTLSEQFLIDCDPDSGGCHGKASLLNVFGFIITKLGGVLKYDSYEPYTARQHECKFSAPPPYPVPVVGMHRVPQDEDAMVEYLYKYGPLSAAINSKSMDDYDTDNGVYIDEPTDKQCPKDKLDHTILIVGYNIYVDKSTGANVPYWIIKNSWGSTWGDKGFYYLVRGRNACGIASDVSFASVV